MLTVWPPDTTPTLSVMPFVGSVSACSASVLCASSLIALMPASKFAPECAALPVISKRMKQPPLRPVTTVPDARPGSELNTARARARMLLDHRARERRADLLVAGEQRRAPCAGAPPNFFTAASTKQFITSPAFMSATPGP